MADSDSAASANFQWETLVGGGLRQEFVLSPAAQTDDANAFAFPENPSLPQECYFCSRSSGEKRQLDVSSLLLLQNSHSHAVSLNDLLVVATAARLDPRPGRSHTGAVRDRCIQDQEAYSHCLTSGQRGCERN